MRWGSLEVYSVAGYLTGRHIPMSYTRSKTGIAYRYFKYPFKMRYKTAKFINIYYQRLTSLKHTYFSFSDGMTPLMTVFLFARACFAFISKF